MRTPALFDAKNFVFLIYGMSARTRGEVNFSQFSADVFYGRPPMLEWIKHYG